MRYFCASIHKKLVLITGDRISVGFASGGRPLYSPTSHEIGDASFFPSTSLSPLRESLRRPQQQRHPVPISFLSSTAHPLPIQFAILLPGHVRLIPLQEDWSGLGCYSLSIPANPLQSVPFPSLFPAWTEQGRAAACGAGERRGDVVHAAPCVWGLRSHVKDTGVPWSWEHLRGAANLDSEEECPLKGLHFIMIWDAT